MSKATKRKHVTKEVTEEFVLPEGDRQVVKILSSKGNNLHEVETADGVVFLVSMPTKFRKNVWIKRGDYVMVQPIEEGDKVKAEISHILYKPQITYIQQEGKWPAVFDHNVKSDCISNPMIPDDMLPPSGSEDSDSVESNGELNANPNRQTYVTFDDDDDDVETDEELGTHDR